MNLKCLLSLSLSPLCVCVFLCVPLSLIELIRDKAENSSDVSEFFVSREHTQSHSSGEHKCVCVLCCVLCLKKERERADISNSFCVVLCCFDWLIIYLFIYLGWHFSQTIGGLEQSMNQLQAMLVLLFVCVCVLVCVLVCACLLCACLVWHSLVISSFSFSFPDLTTWIASGLTVFCWDTSSKIVESVKKNALSFVSCVSLLARTQHNTTQHNTTQHTHTHTHNTTDWFLSRTQLQARTARWNCFDELHRHYRDASHTHIHTHTHTPHFTHTPHTRLTHTPHIHLTHMHLTHTHTHFTQPLESTQALSCLWLCLFESHIKSHFVFCCCCYFDVLLFGTLSHFSLSLIHFIYLFVFHVFLRVFDFNSNDSFSRLFLSLSHTHTHTHTSIIIHP